MAHTTNYRGKVLTQLINVKEQYKDSDKILSGYIGGIIEDVCEGWKKEEKEQPPVIKK